MNPSVLSDPERFRAMHRPGSTTPKPLTAAFDRGPARHFHGRTRILGNFIELLERAMHAKGGTIFLVQGAPGAGKTALLSECEKHALESDWGVASIPPHALWDPGALLHGLGGGSRLRIAGGSGMLGYDAVVKVEAELDFTVNQQNHTVLEILESGKKPLLLMLDEAQVLGMIDIPSSDRWVAASVLNSIHNGKLSRPVILLAAGLGMTLKSFGSLGIARFSRNCFVELGALSNEAERAVIHDWLTKDGGAIGDPTAWIDAIARESCGWPHHILSYVDPAAIDQLKADGGNMVMNGLNAVLEVGREGRNAYYKERAYGFPEEERQSLAKVFSNVSLGGSTTRRAIMSSLAQDLGPDEAEDLFNRAWNKGLLDERDGRYVIPIPSMQDWLVSNYAPEQIKFPQEPQPIQNLNRQNPGIDFGGR